jgi:choline dehydrogenase
VFDYLVVGAGSAGCVVASRLTEDRAVRVLLLEAGGPDRMRQIRVPAAFPTLFKTAVDWAFYTEEQEHLHRRRLYWPRGKVLGGSSSLNAMIYVRGHPRDYDDWRAAGNPGWGFADVLPAFKKAENQERGPSEFHGVGGPLHVADLRCPNLLSRAFLEACVAAGIPRNDDFNGKEQEGAGFYQVTQKGGKRHSAADAYLRPALRRPNLTVVTEAHATRVLFEGRRAVGVEYLRQGQVQQERAGEVILCGGAVNSPHLLLLSGVGPAGQLKSFGIPVLIDLPGVGRNLQDHVFAGACWSCTRPVTLDGAGSLLNFLRCLALGRGPLTSNVGEAGAFVKSDPHVPAPDLQMYFAPAYYVDHGFTRPPGCGFSVGACLLRPRSRGAITLRSGDPLEPPAIQPAYLESADDLRTLVAGVKRARALGRSAVFDPFRGEEHLPGKQVQTDEDFVRYVRDRAETLYHPAGTCKMGNDASSVVSPRLEVHGTSGLRVVDASVMPTLIAGNTNAPTIMIAEKAVDLIKGKPAGREEAG